MHVIGRKTASVSTRSKRNIDPTWATSTRRSFYHGRMYASLFHSLHAPPKAPLILPLERLIQVVIHPQNVVGERRFDPWGRKHRAVASLDLMRIRAAGYLIWIENHLRTSYHLPKCYHWRKKQSLLTNTKSLKHYQSNDYQIQRTFPSRLLKNIWYFVLHSTKTLLSFVLSTGRKGTAATTSRKV